MPRSSALLLRCCMSSALVVWFRPEHTFDVNLFFVSTHHTSLLMAAQLQRAQTASYFGWNETWVCAPGMQLKWAPAANGHLAHESRQARSQQENLGCTPVCSTNHFTLQPCSYLTCLSALLLHVNSLWVLSSEPLQLCPTYKLNSASGMQWTHRSAALYHWKDRDLPCFQTIHYLDNTYIHHTKMCILVTYLYHYILLYLRYLGRFSKDSDCFSWFRSRRLRALFLCAIFTNIE